MKASGPREGFFAAKLIGEVDPSALLAGLLVKAEELPLAPLPSQQEPERRSRPWLHFSQAVSDKGLAWPCLVISRC